MNALLCNLNNDGWMIGQGGLAGIVSAALAPLPSITASSPLDALQQALQALTTSVVANISSLPVCHFQMTKCPALAGACAVYMIQFLHVHRVRWAGL
jgi:hypothetical protein